MTQKKPVDLRREKANRGKPVEPWRDTVHVVVVPVPKDGKVLELPKPLTK